MQEIHGDGLPNVLPFHFYFIFKTCILKKSAYRLIMPFQLLPKSVFIVFKRREFATSEEKLNFAENKEFFLALAQYSTILHKELTSYKPYFESSFLR